MRKQTRKKPYECEQCDYSCAHASHLKRHRLNHTGESLSSVASATILALKLVIWKYTKANTQEKNLSTVTNVTTPVLGLNVWKYTSVTIQERNPSNVTSAVTLANNQVTCSGTRGRCTRQHKTCKNKQFRLYWTGHISFLFMLTENKFLGCSYCPNSSIMRQKSDLIPLHLHIIKQAEDVYESYSWLQSSPQAFSLWEEKG